MKIFTSLLLLSLLFGSCSLQINQIPKEQNFSLNKSKTIESTVFTVTQINDSRCPVNTNCIVAGKAEVFLSMSNKYENVKLIFCIGADCKAGINNDQTSIKIGKQNYRIQLISVNPVNSTTPTQKAKTAQIKITTL